MSDDRVGSKLAQFRLVELVGEGGMGRVFRARDERLERDVALKVVHPRLIDDARYRRRLLEEAKAAAAVSHAAIATVYEVGETSDEIFIAMEWVEGETLAERLAAGELGLAEVSSIGSTVARGLAKAHAAGVIHRDLKPDNIMLTVDSGVKVLDFGIARRRVTDAATLPPESSDGALGEAPTATAEGVVVGTPGYMSPEQALGEEVDTRTDVFSLGILLYEATAGRRPFGGHSLMETAVAVTRDDPAPWPTDRPAPRALRELVERCLAKDREARPDAGEVADALEKVGRELGSLEEAATVRADAPVRPARRGGRGGMVAFGTVAALALGWWAVGEAQLSGLRPDPAIPSASAPAPTAIPITALPPPATDNEAAIKAYRQGLRAIRDANWGQGRVHLLEALKHDPQLAEAHMRLTLEETSMSRMDSARKHLRQAVLGRARLSPRDRAYLEAMERYVSRDPPDSAAMTKRLKQATEAHPLDAELHCMLAWSLLRGGRQTEALPPAERAIALDPHYADALQVAALSLEAAKRHEEAAAMIDRCIDASSSTIDCIYNRVDAHDRAGRCEAMLADLKLMQARGATTVMTFRALAATLLALGQGTDAVAEALERANANAEEADAWRVHENRLMLSALTGDFAAAMEHAEAMGSSGGAAAFIRATAHQLAIADETGDEEAASKVAKTFLAKRHTLGALPRLTAGVDPMPLVLDVAHRGGDLDDEAFSRERQAWIERWRAQKASEGVIWLQTQARTARSDEEIQAALGAMPTDYDMRSLAAALLHARGGHADAKERLEAATNRCAWLEASIPYLQAMDALGRVLEDEEDEAGACEAYGKVMAAWGEAKPRSKTAEHAKARLAKLRCKSSPPGAGE